MKQPEFPVVRFIIDTYCKAPDRYGNVSRWSRITSTVSGRTLNVLNVGGAQNVPGDVYKAIDNRDANFDPWSCMHYGEHEIPRSLFREPKEGVYESSLTAEVILELERRV